MNILETLIQLRDDLKTWVTNNLVALDNKIESKTITIDNKLKTDSTNPVQNKIIKAKTDELANAISALDNVIETIQNNIDNITDDGSGEFNIADPNGNVIFKVNKDGIHTTNINTNGDNFTISDANGNVIFKIDANGAHTTKLKLSSGDIDTQLDTIEDEIARIANEAFSGDYNDLTNKPNIEDDESGEYIITDNNGNIIFKVNTEGTHTTEINLSGTNVKETLEKLSDDIDDVADSLAAHKADTTNPHEVAFKQLKDNNIEDDESGEVIYADSNGNVIFRIDANGAHTTKLKLASGDIDTQLDTIENEIARVASEAFSGNYNDLTNKPNLEDDESGEYIIADEAGNIIFKVDANGAHTTEISLGETKVKETLETLSENIDSISINIDTTNTRIDTANTRIDNANTRIDTVNSRIETANSRIDTINTRIGILDSSKANAADLATVAMSGDYNSLINKPYLTEVAHTGDYNDLINTPVIKELVATDNGNGRVSLGYIPVEYAIIPTYYEGDITSEGE